MLKNCLLAAGAVSFLTTIALAQQPQERDWAEYHGKWVQRLDLCAIDGDHLRYEIGPSSINGYEQQCRILGRTRSGHGFQARAACSQEGDEIEARFTIEPATGGRIAVTESSGGHSSRHTLSRCPTETAQIGASDNSRGRTQGREAVQRIPCAQTGYGDLANMLSRRPPLGIPLDQWDSNVEAAVLDRVRECSGQVPPHQTRAALQLLPDRLRGISREAQARRDLEAHRARMAERVELEQTQRAENQRRQAAAADRMRAQEEAQRASEQTRRQIEEEQRRAQQQEQARVAQERLAGASRRIEEGMLRLTPAAREFLRSNPGLADPAAAEGGLQGLLLLHTADIALRVCRERGGQFQREIDEAQRRARLTEEVLVTLHDVPHEKLRALREQLGVDSGRGALVSNLRAAPDAMNACREFIAMFDLGPPLQR